MSKENAKAFLQRLLQDRNLLERCRSSSKTGKWRIASEIGLPHTEEDMRAVIAEGIQQARRASGELTDEQLSHIAGGVTRVPGEVISLLSDTPLSDVSSEVLLNLN